MYTRIHGIAEALTAAQEGIAKARTMMDNGSGASAEQIEDVLGNALENAMTCLKTGRESVRNSDNSISAVPTHFRGER